MLWANVKRILSNIEQEMDIENFSEVILLKEVVEETVQQILDREVRRLKHSTEFLKDPNYVCAFITSLLNSKLSVEKMYQVIFGWSF